MTFGPTQGGKLRYVITHNVNCANQKTESVVFCWLRAHVMFDVACLPAFAGTIDVIPMFIDDFGEPSSIYMVPKC